MTMYGGIRTDRAFVWSTDGTKILDIYPEDDPKLLERLVGRTGWIESYAN